MRQINLLPWREARRKQRKREFGILGVATLVFSLLVVGVVQLCRFSSYRVRLQQDMKRHSPELERRFS